MGHHTADRAPHRGGQLSARRTGGWWQRPHDDSGASRQIVQRRSQHVPKSPFDPVSYDCSPNRSAHHKARAGRLGRTGRSRQQMDDDKLTGGATALSHRRGKLPAPADPLGGRKHGESSQRVGQADSRLRPFVRRAAMIARPARVRMRRRKPCVLARRRLLGWNVRFTVGLQSRTAPAVAGNEQAVIRPLRLRIRERMSLAAGMPSTPDAGPHNGTWSRW